MFHHSMSVLQELIRQTVNQSEISYEYGYGNVDINVIICNQLTCS